MLDIVQSLVSGADEIVQIFRIAHAVVLPPVLSELKLCLFWGGIATETVPIDDERHVAAVFTEEAQTFHVGLNDVAGARRGRDLIRR